MATALKSSKSLENCHLTLTISCWTCILHHVLTLSRAMELCNVTIISHYEKLNAQSFGVHFVAFFVGFKPDSQNLKTDIKATLKIIAFFLFQFQSVK
jgi:hypothetical protein